MKLVVCLVLFLFLSNSFSQNVAPQFSELQGMKDQSANTHLFYRIYSSINSTYYYEDRNDIYHFNLFSGVDTLFLNDYVNSSPMGSWFVRIKDYEFWQNNPSWFIYCGTAGDWGPYPFIVRFDGQFLFNIANQGSVWNIDISKQNDSLLYAGAWASEFGTDYMRTLKSTDGGHTWQSISDTLVFLSLNPYDDNLMFAHYEYEISELNDELYRSIDGGINFSIVDTSKRNFQTDIDEFYYDIDETHFYRVYESNYSEKILKVSSSKGSPFSWTEKYSSSNKIFVSIEQAVSGSIYLANEKNIYVSNDYGNNFNLYKSLDRKIVGIYKKPNSDKLYAATKYKIYEITPDSTHVIKSLPIADEELKFYPLVIGNKWVYNTWGWWVDTTIHYYSGVTVREVISDTIMSNGQFYYKLFDPTTFNYPPILFERIDTASGKVFRYDNTLGLPNDEYLIEDLFAELGDSIWSSRHQYQNYIPFICIDEDVFNKWGIQSPRKIFNIDDLTGYTYSLSQGVGIDSIYSTFDFGENFKTLKGCIINGVLYGDTTVVSVEDVTLTQPMEFSLSQNYPNPFNPSTTIKFTIPTSPLNPSPYQGEGQRERLISLKVYDVLGNEIAILVNEEKPAGSYEIQWNAKNYPSGVYFYQLRAGNFIQTKKMILLK